MLDLFDLSTKASTAATTPSNTIDLFDDVATTPSSTIVPSAHRSLVSLPQLTQI